MDNIPPKENKNKLFSGKTRSILLVLVILGVILAFFFAARAFHGFQRVRAFKRGGGETNVELIRGWMTVDYITKMYHVPPDVVLSPLNLPVQGNEKRSLESLIRGLHSDNPKDLMEKVKKNIDDFQQKDMQPAPDNKQPPQAQP